MQIDSREMNSKKAKLDRNSKDAVYLDRKRDRKTK